jgi:hypothetical protein
MEGASKNNPVTGYDVTIRKNEKYEDWKDLAKALDEWCSKWVFQLEEGDTGYVHYQVRLRLWKKKRPSELGELHDIFNGHWSVTCSTVHRSGSFNYVMKADGRLEGPWDNRSWKCGPKLTRQLKEFESKTLWAWQKKLLEILEEVNDRAITLIIDQKGNSGKSIFCEYLQYHKIAFKLPTMQTMEDISQFAFSFDEQSAYVIDMPRALKKDHLYSFYAGLEELKNGFCYDKRYSGKCRYMDRPNVVVFTNKPPEWDMLSEDRWDVYEIQQFSDLHHYASMREARAHFVAIEEAERKRKLEADAEYAAAHDGLLPNGKKFKK